MKSVTTIRNDNGNTNERIIIILMKIVIILVIIRIMIKMKIVMKIIRPTLKANCLV